MIVPATFKVDYVAARRHIILNHYHRILRQFSRKSSVYQSYSGFLFH